MDNAMFEAFIDELRQMEKLAGTPFLEQDRKPKVKEIYKALKRDHPNMPAEMKARIAERKSKKSAKSRKSPKDGGPKYKAPLTYVHKGGEKWKKKEAGKGRIMKRLLQGHGEAKAVRADINRMLAEWKEPVLKKVPASRTAPVNLKGGKFIPSGPPPGASSSGIV